jgi:uncharacterized protein (DUF849 family)
MSDRPLVIAVSINGERSKAINPNVPRTPDEIVATALSCYEAGASILHAHCSSVDLSGAAAAADYLAAWRLVKERRPESLWYPTLTRKGGDDLEHVTIIDDEIGLEYACVDPGAVAVARLDDEGLPAGRYYATTFDQIRSAFSQLAERRIGPQIAIYEPGYLRTVLAYHAAGRLPAGAVVNFYFGGGHGLTPPRGLPFGLPPTRSALMAYLDLLGDVGLPWTASIWGGDILQTELPQLAIALGGHVQLGLESHFDPSAKPSNEDQIRQVAAFAASAGRRIATSAETLSVWRNPRT